MTPETPPVEPVESGDLSGVEALLQANELPHRDVRDGATEFYGIYADGALIGVGGLELYGSHGLLRSLVIEESYRGRGLGSRLCSAVEDIARDRGVRRLFLLTTSATNFFHRQGYDAFDRNEVPAAIAGTAEFSELCPTTARCMTKQLE